MDGETKVNYDGKSTRVQFNVLTMVWLKYVQVISGTLKRFVDEGIPNTSSCSVYVPSTFALAFAPHLCQYWSSDSRPSAF